VFVVCVIGLLLVGWALVAGWWLLAVGWLLVDHCLSFLIQFLFHMLCKTTHDAMY
jgi:hypothetical protein